MPREQGVSCQGRVTTVAMSRPRQGGMACEMAPGADPERVDEGRAAGPGHAVEVREGTGEQGAPARRGNAVSRKVWAALGFLTFGLGALGVALPFLPTTPFMLLAAFCFARSSERLNAWFKSTRLYKRVLEGYVRKRAMTVKAKLTILVPVTILLVIGFAMMGRVPVGRIMLVVVWVAHVVYFGFVVKTDHEPAGEPTMGDAAQPMVSGVRADARMPEEDGDPALGLAGLTPRG